MDLQVADLVVRARGQADAAIRLPAGRRLRIQLTGGGPAEELLDVTVPAGKVWKTRLHVGVQQEDA